MRTIGEEIQTIDHPGNKIDFAGVKFLLKKGGIFEF
jgi:hypothetical protein